MVGKGGGVLKISRAGKGEIGGSGGRKRICGTSVRWSGTIIACD